ncbi:histidine phosphatase family protein [Arthrobacter sp. TMP15]|uniref:histidine phosphatase family protein n=1 Tax=Arthrobacter sp. TMP15 TaxID=3140789 RepID=UPI0031BB9C39
MRLILIRHGQTPNNVRSLLDTAVPGPGLTLLGEAQAAAVPAAVAHQSIDALYISNLTRTALTAAPLAAERRLAPLVRDGLREISAGSLELKGDIASIEEYLRAVKSWLSGDLSARMPGADSGYEVLERFDAVVEEAATHETVAMVSHGAMIRFWAGYRGINIDWSDKKFHDLSNTGIVTLDGEPTGSNTPGGWKIQSWQGAPAGGLSGLDADGPTAELTTDALTEVGKRFSTHGVEEH